MLVKIISFEKTFDRVTQTFTIRCKLSRYKVSIPLLHLVDSFLISLLYLFSFDLVVVLAASPVQVVG